jgi:hypothetical protein
VLQENIIVGRSWWSKAAHLKVGKEVGGEGKGKGEGGRMERGREKERERPERDQETRDMHPVM